MAIWLGSSIAQAEYFLVAIATFACFWLLCAWQHGPLPEAVILACAYGGYIIGNRGFAQVSLLPQIPVLPAEAALLVGLSAAAIRMARRQASGLLRDSLNFSILAWVLLGVARLWPDVKANGIVAIRDFATIYYALFFFLAQVLAAHAPSARLLRRSVVFALALLPFSYLLFRQFPEFTQRIVFREAPLIFYKDDLVAAYLFAGFFMLLALQSWPLLVRIPLATAAYASVFSIGSSRAAIVGLGVTTLWWALARRWLPLKLQAIFVPLVVTVLLLLATASHEDFGKSRLYALYEHLASMADLRGTRLYTTAEREYVGDNNKFRFWWWRTVAEETLHEAPIFGLGFGADLAERFVRTYELDLGEDFTTRSPHSIAFTVLGRMGLAGALIFGAIIVAMAVRTRRLVRIARENDAALAPLGWWSISWVVLSSACFGVVLEGPMGALVFWTSLGLANAETTVLMKEATAVDSSEMRPALGAPDTPVAASL